MGKHRIIIGNVVEGAVTFVFMSAHSKTPYSTPSMDFYSGKGVVRGRRGQQLGFAVPSSGLSCASTTRTYLQVIGA